MKRAKSVHRTLSVRALLPTSSVAALRVLWLFAILWNEVGTFYSTLASCRWPDAKLLSGGEDSSFLSSSEGLSPTHVLLVADPQVRAPHEQPAWKRWLHLTDLSLRKRWMFARRRLRPDAVVFLGDMLDNGRNAKDDDEYRGSFEHFKSIFINDPSTAVYYVPGNHDIGLGRSSRSSASHARKNYLEYFGPLNDRVSIANHTLVILDAPGLVEEDYRRAATGMSFEAWQAIPNGAIDFINRFAAVGSDEPIILFSHIPLFRPDTAPCGPLRERGTIRRGVGPGFQNMVMRDSTNYILKYVRPAVVFSGNDHDYCEYIHSVPLVSEGPEPKIEYVREVTVKAISSSRGIHRPGFHLLSLSPSSTLDNRSFADVPCFFPDEQSIYTTRYLPLIFVSLLVLAVSAVRKHRMKKVAPEYLELDHEHERELDDRITLTPNGTSPLSASSFPQHSPESGMASTAIFSSFRTTGASTLAPTLRAAANGQHTPHTPDFTVGGSTPIGFRSSGTFFSAPPSGVTAAPARLHALSESGEDERGDGLDEEEFDQMARYRAPTDEKGDYFSLTLDRARRRRRFAWTWTFELGGRRRRLSIGLPYLLEHICRTFVRALGGGPRSRPGKAVRESVIRLFLDDLLAAAYIPALLYIMVWILILM